MFTRRITIPFVAWAILILYQTFVEEKEGYLVWIIPPSIALMLIYIFSPQINYWWNLKRKVTIDPQMRGFLMKISPFYNQLDQPFKLKFEQRLNLYILGVDWSGVQIESISEDTKAAIAVAPVTMTLYQEDFLMPPFERIVFYKHPFPSPKYKFLHASEADFEDHVIIFSIEQVFQAFIQPKKHFNIVYYEYGRIFRYNHPDLDYPDNPESYWGWIESVSGFTKEYLTAFTGFEHLDRWGIIISLYFVFPEQFKQIDPSLFQRIQDLLRQPIPAKMD